MEPDDLVGPDNILQCGLEYWERTGNSLIELEQRFDKPIQEMSLRHPERAETDKKDIEEWTQRAQTDRGDMQCYLRWLFMQENFRVGKLCDLEYLPKDALNWDKEDWKKYADSTYKETMKATQTSK